LTFTSVISQEVPGPAISKFVQNFSILPGCFLNDTHIFAEFEICAVTQFNLIRQDNEPAMQIIQNIIPLFIQKSEKNYKNHFSGDIRPLSIHKNR